MKIRDLIEVLRAYDPDEDVYTVATCHCCTHFVEVNAECVGRRDVEHYFQSSLEMPQQFFRTAAPDAYDHLDPADRPRPRSAWERPGVVIAGSDWSFYPDVPEAA